MKKNIKKNQSTKIKNNSSSNWNAKSSPQRSKNLESSDLWLCGKHPVFTILQKKRRQIFEILATKNSITSLEKLLQEKSLSHLTKLIQIVDHNKIEAVLGRNQIHQDLAIRCSRLPTQNQNDLLIKLEKIKDREEKLPILLLLDQVSDPHNIGAIIRSAISFGVSDIIFCEHNAPKETATIVKSSAGTIEMANLFVVTNFNNLFEKLKKIDYWCVGLAGEAKISLNKIREYQNIALVVGSEGDGIRDLVKKNCDLLTRIEIDREVESLNASVAAAIALYEITRN